jgi:hypothetical protein
MLGKNIFLAVFRKGISLLCFIFSLLLFWYRKNVVTLKKPQATVM